jgi:hypothetical protein
MSSIAAASPEQKKRSEEKRKRKEEEMKRKKGRKHKGKARVKPSKAAHDRSDLVKTTRVQKIIFGV